MYSFFYSLDLAGHEKYLKTTVFGLTGHAPDFAQLMVGANMGVSTMTKEHLGIALALRVPVYVVVTKVKREEGEYHSWFSLSLLRSTCVPITS